MGDTAEERGRGRGRTSSSRSSSSSCRCSSGLAADIVRRGCHQLGKESRRTPRAWGLLSKAEAGAGQCWPSVGTRGVVDSRVGGLCAGIPSKYARAKKKKVYNTKARNEGFKRSLRREGWIPCDVGVPCSMIGSPQSPDGMAGLVLQKRHRPWSDQGREGRPKTLVPSPGHFSFLQVHHPITRPPLLVPASRQAFLPFFLAAIHRHCHARFRSRRRQPFLVPSWAKGPVGVDWI